MNYLEYEGQDAGRCGEGRLDTTVGRPGGPGTVQEARRDHHNHTTTP